MNRQIEIKLGDDYHQIVVTSYEPIIPGRFDGPPEACYPDEGGESEWHVLVEDEDGNLCVKDAEGAGLSIEQFYAIEREIVTVMERDRGNY